MKVIKITGGIGAGKTLAGETLKEMGEIVIDADEVNKKFRQAKYLASASIFGDAALLRHIETKTHPLIAADIEKQIEEYKKQGRQRVFVLIPALKHFAAGIKCDFTIALVAREELRIERVIRRSGLTYEEIKLRIANQAADADIAADANAVIENNGGKESFIEAVKKAYNSLV